MGAEKTTTMMCAILAIDHSNMTYRACSICERPLPGEDSSTGPPTFCNVCNFNAFNPGSSGSKHLFRVLMSIATDKKVITAICFDRAARVLLGCSANEFLAFTQLHPTAVPTVNKILEGEMFRMTLSKPKNGNAQHLRVATVVPLGSNFRPAIDTLRELYC